MTKSMFASLALLAACTAPARAPVTNVAPVSIYTLVPLSIGGGEDRHSSVHSTTGVTGTLEVRGATASLALTLDTFIGYRDCPEEVRSGRAYSMQQCAPPDAKPERYVNKYAFHGDVRPDHAQLVATLRTDKGATLDVRCTDSYLGLACAIERTSLFAFPGAAAVAVPHTLAFASGGTKRFSIAPMTVKDLGRVTGTLAMTGGAISFALAVDDGPIMVLAGTATYYDHAFVFAAQTSLTRNLTLVCAPEGDRLRCKIGGGIDGKALYGQMLLEPAVAPNDPRAPLAPMGAFAAM